MTDPDRDGLPLLGVGVDGAPGGWVAAACCGRQLSEDPAGRRTELHFFGDIRALAAWRTD